MSLMSDKANRIHHQRGSSLLEGLLAILLFSIGLLSLLMLLSATLIESSNARYRIEASLLISDLVSHMWIGDHSLNGLKTRFADTTSKDYQSWFTSVSNRFPGVSAKLNAPQITIDDARNVTVNIRWQVPGDSTSHQMIVQTLITD
jgi:type IV pilus assembly protein PilV